MKMKNQPEEERENIVEECLEDIRNQMRLNTSKINQYKGKKYIHKEYRISSNQIGKLRYFIDKVYKRATFIQINKVVELVKKMINTEKYYLTKAKKENHNIKVFEYSKSLLQNFQVKIKENKE